MKALIFGLGTVILIPRLSYAQDPTAPNVSLGSLPYAYYHGSILSGQETDVFTQASDQDFLITTAIMSSLNCDLYQDSTLLVNGKAGPMAYAARGSLFLGAGILRVEAGSTLTVKAVGDNCTFHISGYHIAPDGPYASVTGEVNHSSTQSILTVPSGKTFILRSVIMGGNQPETCDLYINSSIVLEGNLHAMTREGINSAFTNGNIRIPVSENDSLVVKNTGSSSACHYHMEGVYLD